MMVGEMSEQPDVVVAGSRTTLVLLTPMQLHVWLEISETPFWRGVYVSDGGAKIKLRTHSFHHSRSFADAFCTAGVASASKKSTMNS
jgi:hypothetical protein